MIETERYSELIEVGGESFVKELVRVFIKDALIILREFESATVIGDIKKIKSLTHKLKGSALNVGVQEVLDILILMSDFSETGLNEIKNKSIPAIRDCLKRLLIFIEKLNTKTG